MAKRPREKRQRSETLGNLLMPVYEAKLEESLGNRLRELRRMQALSLRALAEKSGLSANTLSLIENGKTSPSVATLQQIAVALNIPITSFFDLPHEREQVIHTRNNERAGLAFAHGMLEEMGSGVGEEGLQPIIVTFEPNSNNGDTPLSHEGSEFVFCLQGQVQYTVAGEQYVLEPGDSLLFASKVAHSWHNPLDTQSKVMIVMALSDRRNGFAPPVTRAV